MIHSQATEQQQIDVNVVRSILVHCARSRSLMLIRRNIETPDATTHIASTTITMIPVCFKPRLKKAGAAEPVLNAKMLKFAENQTKNI